MKVSDIIQQLSTDYPPDEELMIAWWDRNTLPGWDTEADDYAPVSPEIWGEAVRSLETESGWADFLHECLLDYFAELFDHAAKRLAEEVTE